MIALRGVSLQVGLRLGKDDHGIIQLPSHSFFSLNARTQRMQVDNNLQRPIYSNGHSDGLELDLHLQNDARHDPAEGKLTMKIVYPNPPATILRIWDGPSLKDIQ
jgi:hypothetical protein